MTDKFPAQYGRFRRLNKLVVAVIIILSVAILLLNGALFYDMINDQSELIGREQLDTVSGKLQIMLRDSEILLRQLAAESERFMTAEGGYTFEDLDNLYYKLKDTDRYKICKNIYIAGNDWYVVPDFVVPEGGFDPKERVWFQGARKNGVGSAYISAPYLDVVTGGMCFSVSLMLSDRETIVGMDFDLDALQTCIADISRNGGDALIVSKSGQIVGYPDESVVGQKLSDALPQYTGVFQRILSSGETSMYFNTEISGTNSTVFYSCTDNEWYLISTVSHNVLYHDTYMRVIRNSLLNIGLVAAIILLYVIGSHEQKKTERALAAKERYICGITDDLRSPVRTILHYTDKIGVTDENASKLHDAAQELENTLDSMIGQYSGDVKEEENEDLLSRSGREEISTNKRNKLVILGVLCVLAVTMVISVIISSSALVQSGDSRMKAEVNNYAGKLKIWIAEQKRTVNMFADCVSVNPEIVEDYDKAVTWLNEMTKRFDDISVIYLANSEWEHTIIMNNRWEPEDTWHVEERQWYIDTMNSREKNGFNISAPYYDEQTGLYCVTFSERIYDLNGRFIGLFAADFYLDKLTSILSESYTDVGYAFLADRNGQIINHPNKEYELSTDKSITLDQAGYLGVIYSENVTFVEDYDGKRKAAFSVSDSESDFSIIGIMNWEAIYGNIMNYDLLFMVLFGICIFSIIYMLNRQMKWQKDANEILRRSVDAVERAGRAKSQFLAQMSHEIRTPINAVLGMNEMILRESRNSNIIGYSENIKNAGGTLLTLINSILDFSKIEDGKMEILPINYDTASMINDLVNMIGDRAEKKGLEFITEIDPGIPCSMYGDDVRLRQVIINLLTNAVKYTDVGKVWLRMKIHDIDEGSVILRVEVEDTGIGIKSSDLDKMFQSFQRLDLQKNRGVEGTGLGMSIVRKLLQMMNSELKVESIYGEGSKFWFDIIQGVVDPDGIGDYRKRLGSSGDADDEGMYVYAPKASALIIDDNNMNLLVAKGLLKRSGIHVDTALSGKDGINMLADKFYDIIFLDHMMPELDGVETLGIIRERGLVDEKTAVVMMTANAIVGAKEEYIGEGFDDYLSKPIEVDRLEKLLAQYIPVEKLSFRSESGVIKNFKPASVPVKKQPPARARASRLDKLKLIPGLDINEGMRRCMNSEDFYIELLRSFVGSSSIEELDRYASDDNSEHYISCVHKLMMNAKRIGAAEIASCCREIEKAAADGDARAVRDEHRDLIKKYRSMLGSVSNALR